MRIPDHKETPELMIIYGVQPNDGYDLQIGANAEITTVFATAENTDAGHYYLEKETKKELRLMGKEGLTFSPTKLNMN